MKHTQGEWKAQGTARSEVVIDCPSAGKIIAFMSIQNESTEANAKLIAAAPELLDCVNSVIPVLERLINATPTGDYRNELCDLNIQLQSVINKATA